MSWFYANITLRGPQQSDVVGYLTDAGEVAFVAPIARGATVVFHSDLNSQEDLAARLSARFDCPALLVMAFAESVLMYLLYEGGDQADAYVSSPHDELELEGPAPAGNAETLCRTFDVDRQERRVARILARESAPETPYALALNRHGDLAQALGLPVFAAGASFQSIEIGELPEGKGFDSARLLRTGHPDA